MAVTCSRAQGGTPIPRYSYWLSEGEQQGIAHLDYAPTDVALAWPSPDTILISHEESYRNGDVAGSLCPGSGFYAVPVRAGVARPIATGAPHCQDLLDRKPALTADGKLAFVAVWTPPSVVVRLRLEDGGVDTLAIGCQDIENPTPSPRGDWLAFQAQCGRPTPRNPAIYVVRADGSGLRRISNDSAAQNRGPSWSPDGRHLAYSRYRGHRRKGANRLVVADLEGGERELEVDGSSPAWSPDGRWLAYEYFPPVRGALLSLHIVRTDGTGARQLFQTAETSTFSNGWASVREGHPFGPFVWSPDGQWIAFGRLYGDGTSIWRVNVRGGKAVQVTRPGN